MREVGPIGRRGTPTWAVLLATLLALWAQLAGAAPAPDAARVLAPMPDTFKRPTVLVYPVLDLAPLGGAEPPAAPTRVEAFEAFVSALGRYPNLKVVAPPNVAVRIRARKVWLEGAREATVRADAGRDAYAEVRLETAARYLKEATTLFHNIEHEFVDARAVARTELTRAATLLEKGDVLEANDAFVAALNADPRIRLRADYDRPETLAALERARETLLREPQPPPQFARWPAGESNQPELFIVRTRHHAARGDEPARLEVVLVSSNGTVLPESQPLPAELNADEAGSRLASRLFACLPFGAPEGTRKVTREVRLDAGGAYFVYLENPLEAFGNVGAGVDFTFQLARNISLKSLFMVANSMDDQSAQLREDVVTFRAAFAPGFETRFGPVWFEAHVGLEGASPGAFVTSSSVYCRQFDDVAQGIGYDACLASGGLDRTPRRVLVGAHGSLGGGLDLVDDLYLALRVQAAEYFFSNGSSDLGRPLGGVIALGYRLR